MSLFYRIIYSSYINIVLRSLNKLLNRLGIGFKLPPSGTIKINLENNEIIRFKTNQTDYVAFSIFWHGLYAYEYTYIFEKISKKINGFIDVGSNGGLYSLMAAKKSNSIKILAFDPTPAANYFMNENIKINKVEGKITFFNFALSEKTELLDFFEVKNEKYPFLKYNLGGSSSLVNKPKICNNLKVNAYSLDNFLYENPKHRLQVDVIKVDAEGAEPAIIRGMHETIKTFKPILICEILMDNVGGEIEKLAMEHGYQFFLNQGKQLILVDMIKKNKNEGDMYNYFLVHPSKYFLIEQFVVHQEQQT
jgi:FkbM family methyltransferase